MDGDVAARLSHHLQLADRLCQQGCVSEAVSQVKRGLRLALETFGPHHDQTSSWLTNLAWLHHRLGHYLQAHTLLRDAKDAVAGLHGEDSPRFAACLANLGLFSYSAGHRKEAREQYAAALTILRIHPEDSREWLPPILFNLAVVQGETSVREAIHLLDEAIALLRPWPAGHSFRAECLLRKGLLWQGQGEFHRAWQCYDEAMALVRGIHGEDSPQAMRILRVLASLHLQCGRESEAASTVEHVLRTTESSTGRDSMESIHELIEAAQLYADCHAFEVAERSYRRLIQRLEEKLSTAHPSVAYALEKLADVYLSTGRTAEADAARDRAHGIRCRLRCL